MIYRINYSSDFRSTLLIGSAKSPSREKKLDEQMLEIRSKLADIQDLYDMTPLKLSLCQGWSTLRALLNMHYVRYRAIIYCIPLTTIKLLHLQMPTKTEGIGFSKLLLRCSANNKWDFGNDYALHTGNFSSHQPTSESNQ